MMVQISVRSLSGDAADIDIVPNMTVAQLKVAVEDAMHIPRTEQRLIYAGVQLEETVNEAFRQRRCNSQDFSIAMDTPTLQDGMPLTLEYHGIQKGSVVNVVRRAAPSEGSTPKAAAPMTNVMGPCSANPVQGNHESQCMGGTVHTVSNSEVQTLAAQLTTLSDLQLLVLLRPVLQQRPALQAALLADAQSAITPAQSAITPAPLALYQKGDSVSVWSNSAQQWYVGTINQVAEVSSDKIPQGSVEVHFELGCKWIAPNDVPKVLRKM